MNQTDKKLFQTLKERGLLYQCTNEDALKAALESGEPLVVYEGTDPTASSLHVGHCVPYCVMRRFQQAGHKVILLMGGATACIGDPSGKSELRKMLSKQEIEQNVGKIKDSLKIFLDFEGENAAVVVNNADWYNNLNYIDFMRNVGVHFNVNKMLSSEIYNNRLESGGLTFFEMGYMLMQAYDFVHLKDKYGCTLEYGGADQWANIVAGVELDRKLCFAHGKTSNLIGATNPLLATKEGKKMGKTERGAIWIDRDKISAYDFYQGIYQTPDECVRMMFALFTDDDMADIDKMIAQDIVSAKKRLAFEVTKFVRGALDAQIAQEASQALFGGGNNLDNAPTIKAKIGDCLIDILVDSNLCKSKSEARRMLDQNAIVLNDKIENSYDRALEDSDLKNGYALLKRGKKNIIKIVL